MLKIEHKGKEYIWANNSGLMFFIAEKLGHETVQETAEWIAKAVNIQGENIPSTFVKYRALLVEAGLKSYNEAQTLGLVDADYWEMSEDMDLFTKMTQAMTDKQKKKKSILKRMVGL